MMPALRQAGILVDVTRCIGCNQCVDACVAANELRDTKHMPQQASDGLSADRWLSIVQSPDGGFVRKSCRHCLDAACVSACPVGAMTKSAEGVVLYDGEKCIGCRYCMMACPFGIPRYEWDSAAPLIRKCTFCYERLTEGKMPACVEGCPEQALIFGERDELLALAHERLRQVPNDYLQRVYGEFEVGGTALLYISNIPLNFLGFNGPPQEEAYPELTWEWLSKVPAVTVGAAGLMTGLFWIIGRRMQAEAARKARANHAAERSSHE
jgi:formate dehydrogenase iron-sulfur subunit